MEVDLDLVEDGALTLVVLMSFLAKLEAADWVVAGCVQGFLVHLSMRDLIGSLLRVGPLGVLAEDTVRKGLLLVVHLL